MPAHRESLRQEIIALHEIHLRVKIDIRPPHGRVIE